MSRFAVVDKGHMNGYATYLGAIGFMLGAAVFSVLNGDLGGGAFFGIIGMAGYILLKRTYEDIEWMQEDFIENQNRYLSESEFEGCFADKGFRFPGSQKKAEGDT